VVGTEVTITVLEVQGNRVRIGVEAPDHVGVLRAELTASPSGATGSPRRTAGGRGRE
jgi:sRNA-binding carbon storage regulator CsrA